MWGSTETNVTLVCLPNGDWVSLQAIVLIRPAPTSTGPNVLVVLTNGMSSLIVNMSIDDVMEAIRSAVAGPDDGEGW